MATRSEEAKSLLEVQETEPQEGASAKEQETDDQSSPRSVLPKIPIAGSDSDHCSSCCCCSEEKLVLETEFALSGGACRRRQWRNLIDMLKEKSSLIGGHGSRRNKAPDTKNKKKKKLVRIRSADEPIDCRVQKPTWRSFEFSELAAATNNFSPENLIGKGGHAEVYKGRLPDGEVVAVKKLMKKDKDEEHKIADFLSELGIIAHIDHPNAARLLGFSVDGGLHLVLRFSPHGSISSLLHGSSNTLEWKIRFKVAVGVALGLQYLHYGCPRRIIHRDIKASNILLTQDYEPQISDYGLAKWLPANWTHHIVFPIEGTFGYLAPEYFMHGIADERTDVFAFGVLLLELITGRRAVDSSRQSLVLWAKPLLDSDNVKELADPRLGDSYNPPELKRVALAASMCIHHLSKMRPDMNRVVQILKGEDGVLEWKHRSGSDSRTTMILDSCDQEDYTSSTYLKDLNRHRELALISSSDNYNQ